MFYFAALFFIACLLGVYDQTQRKNGTERSILASWLLVWGTSCTVEEEVAHWGWWRMGPERGAAVLWVKWFDVSRVEQLAQGWENWLVSHHWFCNVTQGPRPKQMGGVFWWPTLDLSKTCFHVNWKWTKVWGEKNSLKPHSIFTCMTYSLWVQFLQVWQTGLRS